MTDDLGASEARDLTGTPAHETLRAYWNVPPGGRRLRPAPNVQGDILANLDSAYRKRNDAQTEQLEERARRAWEMREQGVPMMKILETLNMTTSRTLYRWWKKLGFMTQLEVDEVTKR